MRRTVIGLAAAATLVFAACGGDDDSSGEEDGGSESSSSSEAERFCDEFMELTQQGPAGGTSPDAIVEAMRDLHPPDDIADDFALTIEGTELQAQMAAGGEPDPELQARFEERAEEYQQANMRIQEFLSEECQIGSPPPSDQSGGSGGSSGSTDSTDSSSPGDSSDSGESGG